MSLTAAEQAVLDKIDEDHLVALTRALVRANGQNPPGEEAATVAVLAAAAASSGSTSARRRCSRAATTCASHSHGGAGPGLLLLGHTDVVPVGDGWTKDPFGGVERGRPHLRPRRRRHERRSGGGLSAMAALRGAALSGPVELAALVDEEDTGLGIRAYVAPATAPSFLGCVTAEPTDLQTVVGARGDSYLRVDVHGTACHAGNPSTARTRSTARPRSSPRSNACTPSSPPQPHPLLGPATWSVGQIDGGTGGSSCPPNASWSPTADCCPASRPRPCWPTSARGSTPCGWPTAD